MVIAKVVFYSNTQGIEVLRMSSELLGSAIQVLAGLIDHSAGFDQPILMGASEIPGRDQEVLPQVEVLSAMYMPPQLIAD